MRRVKAFGCGMFIAFLALWTGTTCAQDTLWSRTYGGSTAIEDGYALCQTADGGYAVAGRSYSFGAGQGDVYLIKTDSRGEVLWSRVYGGSTEDGCLSVQQTTDGGYVMAGRTNSFGGSTDVYLIRTDPSGDTLWTRTYGGSDVDYSRSTQQTADGGFIISGYTGCFGAGHYDAYLIKTDSAGDTLWTRAYGGPYDDRGWSVQQTTDGGYIVAGRTSTYFGDVYKNVYLVKTDPNGDTLWSRAYGGDGEDVCLSVQQTVDGGYILGGFTDSFGAGDYDMYLIKTDSVGDMMWSRTYGGSDEEWCFNVRQTLDGGYVAAGFTRSFGSGNRDVYVVKTDAYGDTLWTIAYGGSDWDEGWCIRQTADGGYVVSGDTKSFGVGSRDAMLTKLDSLGNACLGGFVTSTVTSPPTIVTIPLTEVNSESTLLAHPPTTMALPATQLTTVCERVCGDVEEDGLIDLEDVVFLVRYLYINGPAPEPLEAGNVNSDEIIDLADVVYLINFVLKGGPPPLC